MDAEKVHQLDLVVGTVGRKEMHFPTLCACFAAFFGEPCHRFHLGDTRLGGHFTDAGHASVPDDVVDVDFITYKGLLAGLTIDDECQTVAVLSGEIEEAGVLTELICVGRIVHGRIVVSEKENDARSHHFAQRTAALHVSFLCK